MPFTTSKHPTLSRILCTLRMNNPIGLNAAYVSTFDNFIADYISRLRPVDFGAAYTQTLLLKKYPILASCQRFHLSQELYSYLLQGLLLGVSPDTHQIKTFGHI